MYTITWNFKNHEYSVVAHSIKERNDLIERLKASGCSGVARFTGKKPEAAVPAPAIKTPATTKVPVHDQAGVWEIVHVEKDDDIRSEIYTSRNAFLDKFQTLTNEGKPVVARGIGKDGKFHEVARNGWNNDDVVLTAEVNFGSSKKYGYQAAKRYSGMYEIESKKGPVIVSVQYRYRNIDTFRAEMFEAGYDNATAFESVLIRKIKAVI